MEEYVFDVKNVPKNVESKSFTAIVKKGNSEIKFNVSNSRNNVTLDCDEYTANQIKNAIDDLIEYTFEVDESKEKSEINTLYLRYGLIDFKGSVSKTNVVLGNCHIKIKPIAKLALLLMLTKPFIPQTLSELIIEVLFATFGLKEAIVNLSPEEKELVKFIYNHMNKSKKQNFDLSIFEQYNKDCQATLTSLCNKRIFYNKNGVYEICYK